MPLSSVVTLVAERLAAAAIPELPPVDELAPAAPADLPRITVSVLDATSALRSLGEVPGPPQTGALRVDTRVDLADPVLHLPDEQVTLLSADRRVLQIPHGGVVRADGSDEPPFGPGDLLVRRGATTFTPVHAPPTAGQVQLDIAAGTLTFPDPLPGTGTVELGYFVGLWEVRVERFAATMLVDVAHTVPADHADLTAAVEDALARPQWPRGSAMRSIEPTALSASTQIPGLPDARTRRLSYRVDVERIEPVITTSGGPIRLVDVPVRLEVPPGGAVEQPAERFTVESEPRHE